jgi:hypothetical protein
VGHPRASQDRPDRLPLADPALHRPQAEIACVAADQVLAVAEVEAAHSFDAPDAEFTHRDTQCTFEVLIDHFQLGGDPALVRLARIVHAADITEDLDSDPLGPGAAGHRRGRPGREGRRQRLLERGLFVYDALYAWCQQETTTTPTSGVRA